MTGIFLLIICFVLFVICFKIDKNKKKLTKAEEEKYDLLKYNSETCSYENKK